MLLKLKPLLPHVPSTGMGVVYAGAHRGQCIDEFIQCGFNRILFIEPDADNCAEIHAKMKLHPGIVYAVANCAAGSSTFITGMYTETRNQGQSNSILKPKIHSKQYPDIVFTEMPQGQFEVKTIDAIIRENKMYPHQFHMLYMDLQGYELEAMKGSQELLKAVNYVYSEVSREELYEGCALMPDLEKYMAALNFECKVVDWGGGTWGDALFYRPEKTFNDLGFTQNENLSVSDQFINPALKYATIRNRAVVVPGEFQQTVKKPYPEDNHIIFEQYFENFWNFGYNPNEIAHHDITSHPFGVINSIKNQQERIDRIYLPVFWTSYYMNNAYASDKDAMQKLQDFLSTLDPSLKYFTIVQYDNGILNDLSHIDCHVIGMGGGKMDSVIPLTSAARPCVAKPIGEPRKYIANFIGKITHPIRREIVNRFEGKEGFYISTRTHSIEEYTRIIADSYYTFAPRGYGATSFRIKEAYEQASIPVYISDHFLIPGNIRYPAENTKPNAETGIRFYYSQYMEAKKAIMAIAGINSNLTEIEASLKMEIPTFGAAAKNFSYAVAADLYSFFAVARLVIETMNKK